MMDGLVFVGRNPATGLELDPADWAHSLDRRGVDAAVAVAYDGIYCDRDEGDAAVIRLAERYPGRVIPATAWVGPRHHAPDEAARFERLHRKGVRVLAALKHPAYYSVDFRSTALQQALKLAQKYGWAFLAGIENAQDLTDVAAAVRGLRLPVLIRWMRGRSYQSAGEATAVLKDIPHVLFDAGSLTQTALLKKWVQRFGAKRFFYASGSPGEISEAGQAVVESAGLSLPALQAIRHDNLCRVLGEKSHARRKVIPSVPDALARLPKIDTHWHTGGWNLDEPGKDPGVWAQIRDRWRIEKSVFSSIRALNGDLERGNDENFKIVRRIRGAYGLVVVDPTRAELSIRQIRQYARDPRTVGIKTIQDLYDLTLDHSAYAPILKEAVRWGLTCMAHKPGMAAAAKRLPRLRFVCAHMTLGRAHELLRLKNVWLDLATSHADAHETRLPELVRAAGPGRILFASDAPLMDPAWTLGKVAAAGLNVPTLKRIFYQNALNAFPKLKRTLQ